MFGASNRGHVLVVEDDDAQREELRDLLVAHGFEVDTAGSGGEALAAMAKSAPAVLLLDINLPDYPGPEILRLAQGMGISPAVMLISGAAPDSVEANARTGTLGFWTKPLDLKSILAFVANFAARGAAGGQPAAVRRS
jgi:DNA-binding response OmpR family regulator